MKLSNGKISIEVALHGAELTSLVKDGVEYIWNGDPKYWGRHAPILFPIVGQVFNGEYRVDGEVFHLGQHGFARDADFEEVGSAETGATFQLLSSAESLKKYPYDFELTADYKLEGCSVIVTWTVRNIGDKDMYYQIGTHPAFNYLDFSEEDEIHGYMEFYGMDGARIDPTVVHGFRNGGAVDRETPLRVCCPLALKGSTFSGDALMLEDSQVARTVLMDKSRRPYIEVESTCSEVVGIWSPVGKNAPFVCIEPWQGRTDRCGFVGDISERDYIHRLSPAASSTFRYTISVL